VGTKFIKTLFTQVTSSIDPKT